MSSITQIQNNYSSNRVRIEYMLGNLCNHACNYCFPGNHEGDSPWPDKDVVISNLGFMLDKYREIGRTEPVLYIVGGEPTLWKDLGEVCSYFKNEYNCDIRISTNGSRSLKYWNNVANNFSAIEISVHHEFAKVEHLKQVADLMYDKHVFVVANVLMDPSNFDGCVDIINQMKESERSWPLIAKSVNFDGKTYYNEEQQRYLDDHIKRYPDEEWYNIVGPVERTELDIKFDDGTEVKTSGDQYPTVHNLNKFRGFKCNIGIEQVKIFQDGEISANCRQNVFNRKKRFNLYSPNFREEFDPSFKPITCNKTVCVCNSEIVVTKWLPEDFQKPQH